MRKILCIILLMSVMHAGRSQVLISLLFGDKLNSEKLEFGLTVSPTLCNITHIGADYRFGLGLALYFTYKVTDRWFLQVEASPKAAMGARGIAPYSLGDTALDHLFSGGEVIRKINTISLPLLARYRIGGLWFAETGPQIDWMLTTTDEFKNDVHSNELTYTKKINDEITNFDVGWAIGLVYRFSHHISMSAGIRYFYGLTDIVKTTAGNQHNSAWLFNVYIPIGAGRAAEKRQKQQVTNK